ncbi:MAG: metallophosphoesterase family protein [Elusimicrobiota bacterium]|nr:metallophosphoesterase family protein [Elusimicrobiota bacterium]
MNAEKLLVISDVHSNLQALEAVVADISGRGLRSAPLCFLGDAVNMGPFPGEVTRLLSSLKPAFRVRGNHDRYVSSGLGRVELERYFRCPEGADHSIWTAAALDGEEKAWLAGAPGQLSFELGGEQFLCFHASPDNDEKSFKPSGEPVNILCGHIHSPYSVSLPGGGLAVNPGSVGSSLDGNPSASYAVVTAGGGVRAEIIRVKYDVAAFCSALESRGTPWAAGISAVVRRASLF